MKCRDFNIDFFENGFIKNIKNKETYLNLLNVSNIDNPILNVYAKYENKIYTLLNSRNIKNIKMYENEICYFGKNKNFSYNVSFKFKGDMIFVDVNTEKKVIMYFTTDVGLTESGDSKASTYKSQYIDNKVFQKNDSYIIQMRKTLAYNQKFAAAQFGSFNKIRSYVTEGYDFYDLKYKSDKKIYNICKEKLMSRERNYELAFIAFESEITNKNTFYIKMIDDMKEKINNVIDESDIKKSYNEFEQKEEIEFKFNRPVEVKWLNGKEINIEEKYREKENIQIIEGKIGAFFFNDSTHVVLPIKELKSKRTHANIITNANHNVSNHKMFVSTNYMNGVFMAQNSFKNTQINALNTNVNTSLLLNSLEGMRLIIKNNDKYEMLNIPSSYEMGFNYSKWIYELDDNSIEITVFMSTLDIQLNLKITCLKEIEFYLVDKLNDNYEFSNQKVVAKKDTIINKKNKNLNYLYESTGIIKKSIFSNDTYMVHFNKTKNASFQIAASMDETKIIKTTFEIEREKYYKYINDLSCQFNVKIDNKEQENINSFNHLIKWYVHNGLIHFAAPHGLEQHGGAAWGTRDVCQGPVELFSSLNKYNIVRDILIKVFDNQFIEDGNWPQWFMFDEYEEIRAYDSHGDIIVWPLKALADYIEQTNDLSILNEKCGYFSYDKKRVDLKESIFEHVKREIEYIENNFLDETFLSSYSEGDWDDTLQPANSDLRKYMVSGWTVPLTYQAISNFAKVIKKYDEYYSSKLLTISENIKKDFLKYLVKDDVVAGFIYKKPNEKIQYLLHPKDELTGIKYRLLPINRGIISGIFNEKLIKTHLKIIDDHLLCPDGVRLMDKPAKYDGGITKIFQRAESATTVGREISLQYVHAHIRYLEAQAKLNNSEKMYWGLSVVSPFNIFNNVSNANIRQSNAYYSSSEGDFDNRYDYEKNFYKLKTQEIKVCSGWRIYSSGPGIYLKQFITNFLGVKYSENNLIIDPVVPKKLENLQVEFIYKNKKVKVIYKSDVDEFLLNGKKVNVEKTHEKYREGGYILNDELLEKENIINVKI